MSARACLPLQCVTVSPLTTQCYHLQAARITAAERRAREILRFSPLITDAYFHYTPSQIMLAALSLADRGLAERLIQETFHHVGPAADSNNNSGADTPMSGNGTARGPAARSGGGEEDKAAILGPHVRDKVLGAIEACRDMLSKELPERREHWTNVRFTAPFPLPILP